MWAVILLAILPSVEPVTDRCDLVEVNRTYTDKGCLSVYQVIWWERWGGVYRVVAWRLAKEGVTPRLNHRTGEWISRWTDGEIWREVRAAEFRETWTQGTPGENADPEVADRDVWPRERRRELLNVGN